MKQSCDCCGNTDEIAGVACSGLGAASFLWCGVCLAIGAEPLGVCQAVLSKDPKETIDSPYYDYKTGGYKSYQTGEVITIDLKDGRKFNTRKEYLASKNPTQKD